MNKSLKFKSNLIEPILNGTKTATWRVWDDKNLSIGDELDFVNQDDGRVFASAIVTEIIEKSFNDLTDADKIGHEAYKSLKQMYATFSHYYKKPVRPSDIVKIVRFRLK